MIDQDHRRAKFEILGNMGGRGAFIRGHLLHNGGKYYTIDRRPLFGGLLLHEACKTMDRFVLKRHIYS